MRAFFLGGAMLFGMMVAAASCSDDENGEQLCDPGSNVFCRCRGSREAGTKSCTDAGDAFGPCETSFGECEEIEDPVTTSGAGNNGPGTGGGPPDPPTPGELFAACDEEQMKLCNEGLECSMGYCTKSCETYEDCTAAGDCIAFGPIQRCAPYCVQQSDCDSYSESATCGFTDDSVPTFDVVVCAQWGDELQLPPDGYPPQDNCENDALCHLGFEGVERVCDEFGCTDGCHADTDCYGDGTTCSTTDGTLGTCGGVASENIDLCPGVTVNVSIAGGTVSLMGDTSLAPPPSESDGEGTTCTSIEATEEDVYRVVVADAGTFIVNVDSSMSFDPIVYVRSGDCDTGTQLGCEDASGAGSGEILELTVNANDELFVFVDGFSGSTGSYSIDFDLSL